MNDFQTYICFLSPFSCADYVIKRKQVEHTLTERSILEYVQHPFIVSLHYAFQSQRKLFLVMDYLAGGELFFHLGKSGRFCEDRARFYTAEIVAPSLSFTFLVVLFILAASFAAGVGA